MRQVISALQHGAEPVKAVRDRIRDESRKAEETGKKALSEGRKNIKSSVEGFSDKVFIKGLKRLTKGIVWCII